MHYFAPLQVWKVSQLPSKISVMELCIRKTMLPTWTCTWTFLNLIWEPSGTLPGTFPNRLDERCRSYIGTFWNLTSRLQNETFCSRHGEMQLDAKSTTLSCKQDTTPRHPHPKNKNPSLRIWEKGSTRATHPKHSWWTHIKKSRQVRYTQDNSLRKYDWSGHKTTVRLLSSSVENVLPNRYHRRQHHTSRFFQVYPPTFPTSNAHYFAMSCWFIFHFESETHVISAAQTSWHRSYY